MRRPIALSLALVLGTAFALAGALPASAQTGNFQDNNSLSGVYTTTSTTHEIVGQTFTAQATGKLKSVTVWVGGNSNGGYMNLTVENVTGGLPNGAGQHTFGILLGSASTSEQVFYLQGSDGGLDVVAGQTYAFSWYAFGGTKLVSTTSGNAYTGGSMFQGIDNTFPQGYEAAFTDQDFRFVTSIDSTVVTNPTVTGTPTTATTGSAYSFAYSLGGTPVASKARISSGALPPGLGISNGGVISGTPTSVGTYTFTAEVDNGAYATITSSILVQSPLPDAPTGAGASAGYQQATVSFTPPVYIGSSAILDYTVTANSGGFSCTATAPQTSCTVTGLTAGSLYRFSVTARNSSGSGPSSALTGLVQPYAEPGSPSPIWATAGYEQLTVNWGATPTNGSVITGYTVTLSPGGQGCTTTGTSCTVTGLTNGTTYTPTVFASSNHGPGPANSGPGLAPGALASAPTAFSGIPGDQSVVLSWALPADNGGFAPVGYRLQYRAHVSDPWTSATLGAALTYTVSGLTPDDEYIFELTAITVFGTGLGATASTTVTPYGPPAAPHTVNATSGNGHLTVSWLPGYDFGAAISSYSVQYKESSSSVWLAGPTTVSQSVPLPGLTNGVSYDVQVSAANLAGYGPWSGTAVGTPLTTATAPQLFQTIPGDQSVILNWASPADLGGSAVISYLVSYRSGVTWTDVQTTQLTTTFTGLDNGVAYDVRVAAITAAGLGAFATSSVTPYGVPEIVVITPTRGDSEVALSWTAAAPNGSAVIAYELQYKLGTDSIWTTPPTPTALSATVTGLTNGVSYDFRVRAYNQGGAGPFAVVSATPSTVPGVPQGFTAIGGDESITVDWDPPLDDGGSPITSYDVEYKDAFGWVDAAGATTFTGLTNSLLHDVHVRAVNAVGPGPWAILGVTPYQFEPTFSVPAGTTLKAGDTVTVSGDEALPGETVAIELQSAPIHLGSTVVAADGSYSLTVTIPSTAVAGAHHLVATLGGSLGTAQLAVGVLRPSGLAGTGVDPVVPFGSAVLLLLAGGLLFWRSRRGLRTPR